MSEPTITINGVFLTQAQAMTVRVAIENFAIDLTGELKEEIGGIGQSYLERIAEIRKAMYG